MAIFVNEFKMVDGRVRVQDIVRRCFYGFCGVCWVGGRGETVVVAGVVSGVRVCVCAIEEDE